MLMPSIFGENLFDDFFTPFYYDDKDEKKAEKKLYGRRAQNLLKTDIKYKKSKKCLSSEKNYDPYDAEEYDNADDFAEEFGDGDYDEGYDDAYDYWEERD